jgi:hypothetical protein
VLDIWVIIPSICLYTPGGCCIDIETVFFCLVPISTVTSNDNDDDGNDAKDDWKCHALSY